MKKENQVHPDPRMEKLRKKRQLRRKRGTVIVVEVIVLMLLVGVAYAMNKYDKFQTVDIEEEDIQINEGVAKEGYTTIALFGGDSREGALEEGTHTDCIIVASIDNTTKEVRLASIYRDTLTRQTDEELHKVNNAYFKGGATDGINILNTNFDLGIEAYVTVDFGALVDTIDLLGGLEIEIEEDEIAPMNEHMLETSWVAEVESVPIYEAGLQELDGVQAVTYARIRSTAGGDYKRTERQRLVLEKMVQKAVTTNLKTVNKIIDIVFPQVSTSFSLTELVALATNASSYSIIETIGFPLEVADSRLDGVGSCVVPVGLVENVEELHRVLYPNEEYNVSQTVKDIAIQIETRTGIEKTNVLTEE